jgi:hypothetical protein
MMSLGCENQKANPFEKTVLSNWLQTHIVERKNYNSATDPRHETFSRKRHSLFMMTNKVVKGRPPLDLRTRQRTTVSFYASIGMHRPYGTDVGPSRLLSAHCEPCMTYVSRAHGTTNCSTACGMGVKHGRESGPELDPCKGQMHHRCQRVD